MTMLRVLFLLFSLATLTAHAVPDIGFAQPGELPESGILVLPTSGGKLLNSLDNQQLSGSIEQAVATAQFGADADTTLSLYAMAPYDRVLLVETGEPGLDARRLRSAAGAVAQALSSSTAGGGPVSVLLQNVQSTTEAPAANFALGLALGGYRFDKYKTVEESQEDAEAPAVTLYTDNPEQAASQWSDDWRGVAEGVFFARNLVSEPANVIYPESFVDRARSAFRGVSRVRITVLDEKDMERAGMGSLLGVGMGSARPPRLLIVEYNGSDSDDAPVVFAGKGVTFDTGGISI